MELCWGYILSVHTSGRWLEIIQSELHVSVFSCEPLRAKLQDYQRVFLAMWLISSHMVGQNVYIHVLDGARWVGKGCQQLWALQDWCRIQGVSEWSEHTLCNWGEPERTHINSTAQHDWDIHVYTVFILVECKLKVITILIFARFSSKGHNTLH